MLSFHKFKGVVDGTEIKLRGGSMLSDYVNTVKSAQKAGERSLKAWETGKTVAQSGNALGETMIGAHALKESIVEWQKGHYFCCICSGISCSCFFIGAIAGLVPGGLGVWKMSTKAGSLAKGVTYKVTGDF